MNEILDVTIIGAGPAGMSAAIYAKRAALRFLLIEKEYMSGGQVVTTYEVENYPGLHGVSGLELASAFAKHGEAMGIKPVKAKVKNIAPVPEEDMPEGEATLFRIDTAKETFLTRSIVYAAGAHHKKLNIPGEERYAGMGVSYCATCDGNFFRGREVAVIGGGDVALEDAIYLARICSKVTVVIRRAEFRGAKGLQERLLACPNVTVLREMVPIAIEGSDLAEKLLLKSSKPGAEDMTQLPVDGVFIAVGIEPESSLLADTMELDPQGFVPAGEDCRTETPGIYAAGDVRTKSLRQILTAAADGANAIASVETDLNLWKPV